MKSLNNLAWLIACAQEKPRNRTAGTQTELHSLGREKYVPAPCFTLGSAVSSLAPTSPLKKEGETHHSTQNLHRVHVSSWHRVYVVQKALHTKGILPSSRNGVHKDAEDSLLGPCELEWISPLFLFSLAIPDVAGRAVGERSVCSMLRGLCHMLRL